MNFFEGNYDLVYLLGMLCCMNICSLIFFDKLGTDKAKRALIVFSILSLFRWLGLLAVIAMRLFRKDLIEKLTNGEIGYNNRYNEMDTE